MTPAEAKAEALAALERFEKAAKTLAAEARFELETPHGTRFLARALVIAELELEALDSALARNADATREARLSTLLQFSEAFDRGLGLSP